MKPSNRRTDAIRYQALAGSKSFVKTNSEVIEGKLLRTLKTTSIFDFNKLMNFILGTL